MEFVRIEDTESLLPILESRLPNASHSYNMVKMAPRFPKEIKVFVLNEEISDKSCIVTVISREDYCQEMNISVPKDFQTTKEIKNLFANAPFFDWSKKYMVSAIDRSLTPMFFEISVFMKGNSTTVSPCTLYYMDREEAVKLAIRDIPGTTVKALEPDSGVEFLTRTWKYSIENSEQYIRRIIEKNDTAGVYVDGKLTCGILTNTHGLIGMLYTDMEHRQKGLAKVCFQSVMKKCATNGIIPCSCVELTNDTSAVFHEKIGMKASNVIDFLLHTASGF